MSDIVINENDPKRVKLLKEGANLTAGDREATYGDPEINLDASGRLKALVRELLIGPISAAELEAIDNVMQKIARILTGSYHEDNYRDGAAYMAIAGELAEKFHNRQLSNAKVDEFKAEQARIAAKFAPPASEEQTGSDGA